MAHMSAEEHMRLAAKRDRDVDVVIITGMSGSGRTQAMHVFEDMGYFCIDNLPVGLILQIANAVGLNTGIGRHLAVTCDLRSQDLFGDLTDTLEELTAHELSYKVLFLDASDEVLIRRYNENRRRHPIAEEGESLSSAIVRERAGLRPTRELADRVIVMYAGQCVEEAPLYELLQHPAHAYTQALMKAVPGLHDDRDHRLYSIPGYVPQTYGEMQGCRFAPRCPKGAACPIRQEDRWRWVGEGHYSRCDQGKEGEDHA